MTSHEAVFNVKNYSFFSRSSTKYERQIHPSYRKRSTVSSPLGRVGGVLSLGVVGVSLLLLGLADPSPALPAGLRLRTRLRFFLGASSPSTAVAGAAGAGATAASACVAAVPIASLAGKVGDDATGDGCLGFGAVALGC